MKTIKIFFSVCALVASLALARNADAALTLTAGNSATTTPNVATSITGFQIVGPAASTTPVQLRATHGTLSMTTTTGLTFDGASSGSTVNFTGTVANINAALSTLRYTRNSTGTDTLEISLIQKGEIFFTENGHLYKFVSGSYTWSAAKSAAEAQELYGSTGYLVTITSQEENDFVSERLTGDGWIGASDSETEGTWKWVTGPEAGTAFWQGTSGGSAVNGMYEAWAGGEPNQAGEEDCAETYVSSGTWNDYPCGAGLGYVVEFGADGDMPTVVAQNVSIVTADVPAVTSLTPSNGASNVSAASNLTIGFSKNVTKQTGLISIYKSSDDSLVYSIDVEGDEVTASGSTVTINPDQNLPEGENLYVIVPGTAFIDGSSNPFSGITASTTWSFTTADETAPVITDLGATTSTTTAAINWQTNELASTRLWYFPAELSASSTAESDVSPRVFNHTVSLSDLVSCTLYHYQAVSRDAAGNTSTSSRQAFTTLGCPGGSTPSSATSTQVTVASSATTTLSDLGRSFTISTPPNFTATSTSVVIQIKSMAATSVLDAIGIPAGGLSRASGIVFDVTALIDNETVLDSFDAPVTVSYEYSDEDVAGLDESSLRMYHYANSLWERLEDCAVDAGSNVITCSAPHFSVFAIFGSPVQVASPAVIAMGGSVQGRVRNLEMMGKTAEAEALKAQWSHLFPAPVATTEAPELMMMSARAAAPVDTYVRDLTIRMIGDDVKALQTLLITQSKGPKSRALAGIGATGFFGTYTRDALAEYQSATGIVPAAGYFGPLTRSQMKGAAIGGLWW